MNEHNDSAKPFRVEGSVLNAATYDAIATITNEDVKRSSEQWRQIVPEHYQYLLQAEVDD